MSPHSPTIEELADRIDAAVIATTTEHHYAVARELLRRGIHLLVEKPLTDARCGSRRTDRPGPQPPDRAASRPRRAVQSGLDRRGVATCIGLATSKPCAAAATPFVPPTSASCLDLMIHDLDLVLSIVRSPVVDVDAVGVTVFGPHH